MLEKLPGAREAKTKVILLLVLIKMRRRLIYENIDQSHRGLMIRIRRIMIIMIISHINIP